MQPEKLLRLPKSPRWLAYLSNTLQKSLYRNSFEAIMKDVQDVRFSQWGKWRWTPSGMSCHIDWYNGTIISESLDVSIFWASPQHWYLHTKLHGVIHQSIKAFSSESCWLAWRWAQHSYLDQHNAGAQNMITTLWGETFRAYSQWGHLCFVEPGDAELNLGTQYVTGTFFLITTNGQFPQPA